MGPIQTLDMDDCVISAIIFLPRNGRNDFLIATTKFKYYQLSLLAAHSNSEFNGQFVNRILCNCQHLRTIFFF